MAKFGSVFSNGKNKVLHTIDTWPLASFVGLLGLLLVLIIIGNYFRTPAPAPSEEVKTPTQVQIYQNGVSPTIALTAEIEKSGIITIMAQTGGIVQKVPVTEGSQVKKGTRLVSLASNYQGGNAASVSRQLAQRNNQFNTETYQLKKDTISQQRSVAEKQETKASDLRAITRDSLQGTRDLIKLNEEIIGGLNEQIADLEAINVNGASDSAILNIKSGKAQIEAGLLSLRGGLRNSEYTSSNEQEPAQLDQLARDIALKQLELEEKSLDLSKDTSGLQLKLAQITESVMFPVSPCAGIVERVFVKPGQTVTPGTPLAIIRTDAREITAVIAVPTDVANRVSRVEQSMFAVDGIEFSLAPRYISMEPTENNLHTILYSIPGEYEKYFVQGAQTVVTVPLGSVHASSVEFYIPLDAVYQTQEAAFVYVVSDENGEVHARVREVELGAVAGGYVKVDSGLSDSDKVIVTRGMSDGELISVQ